ncbi:hypothetical protein ACFFLZ_04165 [Photobacterium aphoticum]|uniref:hypothetical protein n=1 Tax=Photobacterium aphoticum TaxID=754436 RepID=UPI0011B251AD|nr:hypothetical protein [Photobacterium aphoticum]
MFWRDVLPVSVFDLQPFFLSIAPMSVALMLYALHRKKRGLVKLSLAGMLLAVFLLGIYQYLDYKHLEDCMRQHEVYNPLQQSCIKFN